MSIAGKDVDTTFDLLLCSKRIDNCHHRRHDDEEHDQGTYGERPAHVAVWLCHFQTQFFGRFRKLERRGVRASHQLVS